ncbi:hypothetical protein QUC31_000546 [Theobroma cacao]|nr:PWWP domain - like 10 [Theobroma cacao]
MCRSEQTQASNGKSTEIHDNNDGEEESAALQLEAEVSLGGLIWVKLHGNSWWPAVVVDENSVNGSSKPGNRSEAEVLVRLYGSYEYLYADPMKYYSEFKMVLQQNNGSCREIFDRSLEQDCFRKKSIKPKAKDLILLVATARKRKAVKADLGQYSMGTVLGNKGTMRHSARRRLKDVNDGEAPYKKVRESNGVKMKLESNEPSTEDVVNRKISKKDRLVKKLKPNSPSRRKNPGQNGSNVEDKARTRTSDQDEIQQKLKRKSPSTDKQAKNKANEPERVQKKQRKNNQIVEESAKHQSSKQDGEQKKCKPTRKRAFQAAKVPAGKMHKTVRQKSTSNSAKAKNKAPKEDGVQKKLTNDKQSAKDEVKSKSPKQVSVHKKLRSSSSTANRKTSKLDREQKKMKSNNRSAKEVSNSQGGRRSKTSKQGEEQKKVNPNGLDSDGTKFQTPKQDKLSKEKTNGPSSERTSPGKSPKSSARRMRVMQGLGLIAPSGSPFH